MCEFSEDKLAQFLQSDGNDQKKRHWYELLTDGEEALSKALTDPVNYSSLFKRQIAELAAAEGDQAKKGQLMALILESVLQQEKVKWQGR